MLASKVREVRVRQWAEVNRDVGVKSEGGAGAPMELWVLMGVSVVMPRCNMSAMRVKRGC